MGIIKATTHLAQILFASKGDTQTQANIPLPRTKQNFHKAWSQVRNRSVRRPDVKSLRQLHTMTPTRRLTNTPTIET
jgi:hypothetical protein